MELLSQIDQIAWKAAALGYFYALIVGHLLIGPIVGLTYEIVDPGKKKRSQWQPLMTGVIERALYVSSILVGKAEFIIIWVGLKMAMQYGRWKPESKIPVIRGAPRNRIDEKEVLKGRERFMCSLNGNALSILHSFVSALIIHWLNEGKGVPVAAALIITACLWAISMIVLNLYKNRKI